MATKQLLDNIINGYKHILGDNLVGIYLHGSFVLGSYNPNISDLDYVIVVNQALAIETKKAIMDFTISHLLPTAPKKGIEFHVLLLNETRKDAESFHFDFQFSNMHLNRYLEDPSLYFEEMTGEDKDLAVHLTLINERGLVLYGKPIDEVFSPISPLTYWEGIVYDLDSAEKDILIEPVSVILNLCRTLVYMESKTIVSKKEGGIWAMNHLSEKYHSLIRQALMDYTALIEESANSHNLSELYSASESLVFAKDMVNRVFEKKDSY